MPLAEILATCRKNVSNTGPSNVIIMWYSIVGSALALMSTVRRTLHMISSMTTNEIYKQTLYILYGRVLFLGAAASLGISMILIL